MYGLVNKAVEDLVCNRFGQQTWEAIKLRAGVDVDVFLSMDAYPDEVTYKLVSAAAAVLGMTAAEVLIEFGEHWVLYTGRAGYGDLMSLAGRTLPAFLQNLDALHTQVALSFPSLRPPSFRCTEVTASSLCLHYYSERVGLAPMVIGLLRGLGKMFDVSEFTVEHSKRRGEGADHDEFQIRWAA